MNDRLSLIGVPSSAGAYGPGQEKAPKALRNAGLTERLEHVGVRVKDLGDAPGFTWREDPLDPLAKNAEHVATVARSTKRQVEAALRAGDQALVLGGDCTVELGVVAGALEVHDDVGLIYVDLDTDLHTPRSTTDGALDWMGVAHLLGVEGAVEDLVSLGSRQPMLRPEEVLFFANENVTPVERSLIQARGMREIPLAEVSSDPVGAGRAAVDWGGRFDALLLHLDVDVLDFADLPLAENERRDTGLRFDQLVASLATLLTAPNWKALTITEVNPEHGAEDGATLRTFVDGLAQAIATARRSRTPNDSRLHEVPGVPRRPRPRYAMPGWVHAALEERGLMDAYEARPPYQRNDYLWWITTAKRESTKNRRLEQMLAELERGDAYMKMPYRPHGRQR